MTNRSWWGLTAAMLCAPAPVSAQILGLSWEDGKIRVTAPMLHFVEGPIAERLKSGMPAAFTVSVTVTTDERRKVLKQAAERVVFSYDLWEERFATAVPLRKIGPIPHRSSAAAEAWSVEQLSITAAELPAKKPLWFRLEVRAAGGPEEGDTSVPTSLSQMIDLFGRNRPKETWRWLAEAGPVELDQIPRSGGRRSAIMESELVEGGAALGLQ